jgi:signal transduction histidine kinase
LTKNRFWLIAVWIIVFFLITLLTPLVDQQEIVKGIGERETVYGPLYSFYIFHYLVFSAASLFLIISKLKKAEAREEKYQLFYFVSGLAAALVFGFATNIFLPLLGLQQSAYIGPLAPVIFSSITAYAILKYHLFNAKILATELFVGILAIALLAQAVASDSVLMKVVDLAAFFFFLLFGYLLIKSVLKEVEQREELKKLDELKSQFLSFASHQIRGPLSVVKNYADMMLDGSYGQINNGLSKAAWGIQESTRRLIKLVNDFLDLRKIEENRMDYEFKVLDFVGLAKSVFDEFRVAGEQKGLELNFRASAESLILKADEQRLRQVIQNLLDNAIKYTPQGRVEMTVEKSPAGKAVVRVKDTGLGIRPEILPTIFNQFNRDPKMKNILGTGLGLYIAKEIVKTHQGEIWAESRGENQGTTFFVELPISS